MTSSTEALADYGAAWNEPGPAKRMALLERTWADKGQYISPPMDVTGKQAHAVHVGHFLSEEPDARIELTSQVSRHHDLGYFTRSMIAADGSITIQDHDLGHFNLDEKLMLIAGLFGDPEPL